MFLSDPFALGETYVVNHETVEGRGHVAGGSRLSGSPIILAVVPAEPSVGRSPSTNARPHRTILRPIRPAGVTCAKLYHCAIEDMPKVLPPLPAHCIDVAVSYVYAPGNNNHRSLRYRWLFSPDTADCSS